MLPMNLIRQNSGYHKIKSKKLLSSVTYQATHDDFFECVYMPIKFTTTCLLLEPPERYFPTMGFLHQYLCKFLHFVISNSLCGKKNREN